MTSLHLPIEQLSELAAGREGSLPESARSHVADCASCRTEVAAMRDFVTELKDFGADNPAEPVLFPATAQRLSEVAAFRNRLDAEDEEARRLLDDCGSANEARERLAGHPPTAGMVRGLMTRAEKERESKPADGFEWATLALDAAKGLDPKVAQPTVATHLEGLAWKEMGNAHAALGQVAAGLAAIETATRLLARGTAPQWDLAGADLVRGILLCHQGDFASALRFFRSCATTFEAFGDSRQAMNSEMMVAAAVTEMGNSDEGAAVLRRGIDRWGDEVDEVTRSRALYNLGNCEIERRDFEAAEKAFLESAALSELLQRPAEAARLKYRIGSLRVGRGQLAFGAEAFQEARSLFRELKMPHGVAIVGVELVEVLLSLGRRMEALQICETLPAECVELGLSANALVALSYLRECKERDELTANRIGAVRDFLGRLPEEPELLFVRPQA